MPRSFFLLLRFYLRVDGVLYSVLTCIICVIPPESDAAEFLPAAAVLPARGRRAVFCSDLYYMLYRQRVMPRSFFLLLRFYLRVDGVLYSVLTCITCYTVSE